MRAKKAAASGDHPQVIGGVAHHRVHRVTDCVFELVSGEPTIGFHVTNGWLDRASPSNHRR